MQHRAERLLDVVTVPLQRDLAVGLGATVGDLLLQGGPADEIVVELQDPAVSKVER
jgi:hypothetical protein